MLQTEREFSLPMGYLDRDGTLHRDGVMRLATAADEILPLRDPRVQKNQAYLTVILLSRVITRLGGLDAVTPNVVEGMFAADISHLQQLYNAMNRVDEGPTVTCPRCEHTFAAEGGDGVVGGSWATPSTSSARR
jgi:hypothetical protein